MGQLFPALGPQVADGLDATYLDSLAAPAIEIRLSGGRYLN
jgi:hypothetical protein